MRPIYRLYSPEDAALAALLGSLFAGACVIAANFRALRRRTAARRAVILGLTGEVAFCVAVFALFPIYQFAVVLVINFFFAFVAYRLCMMHQGNTYTTHLLRGGQKAPSLRAAVIGLLIGVPLFFVLIVINVAMDMKTFPSVLVQTHVVDGKHEIVFRDGATERDAARLATALKNAGLFDGPGRWNIQLSGSDRGLIASFHVQDPEDLKVVEYFRNVKRESLEPVFQGEFGEIRLLDADGSLKVTIR